MIRKRSSSRHGLREFSGMRNVDQSPEHRRLVCISRACAWGSVRPPTLAPRHMSSACALGLAALALIPAAGCVRRTLTIETEPQGAIVFLNDEEIGATPVSTDFTWYGDYDVVLRKEGYQALHTHVMVKAPWYQISPIDFFADVLWPGHIHDRRFAKFTLDPWVAPDHDQVVRRAIELRDRALFEAGPSR